MLFHNTHCNYINQYLQAQRGPRMADLTQDTVHDRRTSQLYTAEHLHELLFQLYMSARTPKMTEYTMFNDHGRGDQSPPADIPHSINLHVHHDQAVQRTPLHHYTRITHCTLPSHKRLNNTPHTHIFGPWRWNTEKNRLNGVTHAYTTLQEYMYTNITHSEPLTSSMWTARLPAI